MYKFKTEKYARKVNLQLSDLVHSNYGYSCVIQIMNYCRSKDIYDSYVNNKKYNRKFFFKYYDYEFLFYNRFTIQNMEKDKHDMLKQFVLNYHFYRFDENNMFYISINLLKRINDYILFFENENNREMEFNSILENHYLNDMIYAFNLYYTMLNKEEFLSNREMNNLLTEYIPSKNVK